METKNVIYYDEKKELEAFVVYPDIKQKNLPVVLIFHTWRGRGDFECNKAQEIASLGYIGMAVDMYGKGVLGSSKEENTQLMMPFVQDRNYLRRRALAAVECAKNLPGVDRNRIAVMGYCFGGLCALDVARSGIAIQGALTFHGLLDAPEDAFAEKVAAKILVLNGYDDPMVGEEKVKAFADEMNQAGADWQLHHFSHTMHAFTNPDANDPSFGTVYNPLSAKRAWKAMQLFFNEIFE